MTTYYRFDVHGDCHTITHELVFNRIFAEWDAILGGEKAGSIAQTTADAVIAALEAEDEDDSIDAQSRHCEDFPAGCPAMCPVCADRLAYNRAIRGAMNLD